MTNKRFEQCKLRLRETISEDLISDELLDEMMPTIAQAIQEGKWNKFKNEFVELTQEQRDYLAGQKSHNNRLNRRLKKEIVKHITSGKNAEDFFVNLYGGSRVAGENKNSLAINAESLSNRNKGFFQAQLDSENLPTKVAMDRMTDPKYTQEIFDGIDKLNKGASDFDTLSPEIKAIAKAIRNTQQKILKDLKASGIEIRNNDDYIIRQSHDRGKIGKAGFEAWKNFILPKINKDKTFPNTKDVKGQVKILRAVYDDILGNNYGGINPSKMGAARSIHFAEGKFAEYHNQFGEGSVHDILARTLRAAAKQEALYTQLGTRPREMLDSLEKFTAKHIEETQGFDALKKFEDNKEAREKILEETVGYGRSPDVTLIGKGLDAVKNLQIVSKLGAASISTVGDLPVSAMNFAAKTGVPILKAYNDTINTWTKSLTKENKREVGLLMGIAMDDDLNRFTGEKADESMFGKFTKPIMSATLLNYTTKTSRTASALAFGNNLWENRFKSMENLDPRLKAELESFGITKKEWDILREKGVDEAAGLGVISDRKLQENNVSRKTINKYGAFITSNSNFGAISPDARTKAIRPWVHPDSTAGKFFSSMMLFKTFSLRAVGAIDEIMKSNPNADNSTFLRALSSKGNAQLFGSLMVGSFLTGMAGLAVRDIAFNKTPRDFTKSENLVEAATRTIMPLWGQYTIQAFSGDYDNFYRSLVKDLAGPVGGFADDTAAFISSVSKDIASDKRSGKQSYNRGLRLLQSNLPGTYIPFLRPALDKIFWDGLYEAGNPNYSRRIKKRMKEKGQSFIF